jgi:dienelactone hydrolase
VLAFAQAVSDLRGLADHLRARGAPAVGLSGMSLGGYTTALAATAAPFDFLVPVIPLADVAAVQFEHEALRAVQVPAALLGLGRQALAVVSPLERKPMLAPERVLVIAARHDRVTDPATHAERLAAHFGARLDWFEGGHLLQLGRGEAFAEAARFMRSAVGL